MGVPDVYLFSNDSRMSEFMRYRWSCEVDERNANCQHVNDSSLLPWVSALDLPSSTTQPKISNSAMQKGTSPQLKRSGTCYNYDECDVDHDFICASTKGKEFLVYFDRIRYQHQCIRYSNRPFLGSEQLHIHTWGCNGYRSFEVEAGRPMPRSMSPSEGRNAPGQFVTNNLRVWKRLSYFAIRSRTTGTRSDISKTFQPVYPIHRQHNPSLECSLLEHSALGTCSR